MGVLTGCNSFGNSRLVKELQSENDRLLSEFRGQRDRAAELEKANHLQAARLAESEKLLARLSQGGGAGRLSSLPQIGGASPRSNAASAVAVPVAATPGQGLVTSFPPPRAICVGSPEHAASSRNFGADGLQ